MLQVLGIDGISEIVPGDDLPALIAAATDGLLQDGDVLAVTSKIVSKAEGRLVAAADREAAITGQTVREVASRTTPDGHVTRIVENPLGLVMAAAGVDASNVPDGHVLLLPEDPDASARAIAAAVRERSGLAIGVVVSDTFGRPWRFGQTDLAIGAAGVRVVEDLRGGTDDNGRDLRVTAAATADEIASAADLVKGKTSRMPVAIVRGLGHLVGPLDLPGARSIVRLGPSDMFRVGSEEAWREGYEAGLRAAASRIVE
ncbi:coenzyme F420-0:L-glutamate ligase [Pseudolysinimonas sp.]|uniref:coenzyme F420-0:L-glutamate ligase n=1 Tax=Pseudolysinimonas sp. TaxID=2680009 RepID=UPI003F7E003E